MAPASADDTVQLRVNECKMPDCVMVNARDLESALAQHNAMVDRIAELEAQLAHSKEFPKCGVLEVVPKGRGV